MILLKYDVILFDFDGTLVDSGPGITRSAAWACEQLGVAAPAQEVLDRFVGPPLEASFRDLVGMDPQNAHRATELYRVRYQREGWLESRVYGGVAPLLRALKEAGCYLGIASAKPEIFVRQIAEHFGIARYFDAIAGIQVDGLHADKCALIKRALPKNCDRARAAMVGDRLYDMEAAKRTGLSAVGALFGYGSREELRAAGADEIAESVEDLWRVLLPDAKRPRGLFISFEGADGCGKSTQLNLLEKYLSERGYDVLVTREPGGCAISERIREVVLDVRLMGMSAECEALLYAASRAEHVRQVILPALEDGKIVLCDRFLDSSFAYQACGRELGDDFIRQINAPARVVSPDRTLLFAGDMQNALKRLRAGGDLDRLEVEGDDFFARVDRAYARIQAAEPERVHAINSGRSIEEVFSDVRADVDALIG